MGHQSGSTLCISRSRLGAVVDFESNKKMKIWFCVDLIELQAVSLLNCGNLNELNKSVDIVFVVLELR